MSAMGGVSGDNRVCNGVGLVLLALAMLVDGGDRFGCSGSGAE